MTIYYCRYCGTKMKRQSLKAWIKSYCSIIGKTVRIVRVAVDQVAGMKAFAVVIGLDKELVRVSGDRWWDDCEWHQDTDAITGAQALLKEMGG